MSVKTGQNTFSGTGVLTIGNLPFAPLEIEIEIGVSAGGTTTSEVRRTTGRATFDPATSNVVIQSYQSEYNDGTLKKQSNGTAKIANHYKKSGASVVDSLVMDVTDYDETVPGTRWDVNFNVTVGDSTSVRWIARG